MIIGSEGKLPNLKGTTNSGRAEFVAGYGRRLIGRILLIRHVFFSSALPVSLSMCTLAALANCAKADIVSAQEHRDAEGNIKSIVVNNPTAQIGTVKTPWMFVRPDGKSGFANDFTTNAISVVSEDGTNYYAHVEGPNGDRTKVIHFTVKDGIPSRQGDLIDMAGEYGASAEEMANRKLVGVAQGYLCFYPTDGYGVAWIYNPQVGNAYYDEPSLSGSRLNEKCLAYCQAGSDVYVLCNYKYTSNGEIQTTTRVRKITGNLESMVVEVEKFLSPLSDEKRVMACPPKKVKWVAIGDSEGRLMKVQSGVLMVLQLRLPGPISNITISDNRKDIFATSTATNAFYNLDYGYNTVSGDGGSVKPMVPGTNEGLIRMIDNRSKGGKLMYVTPKGIHSIDD